MPEKLAFSDSWVLLGGFGGNAMVDHKDHHRASRNGCGSDSNKTVAVALPRICQQIPCRSNVFICECTIYPYLWNSTWIFHFIVGMHLIRISP